MTDNDSKNSKAITVQRVLDALREGQIEEEYGILRWSSNYTFLVSVEHEDVTVMAVYKPQVGERPLWDFPDGTLCRRETAAFRVSNELGWQIVPPTVLRQGPRGLGSVQFYVDHDPETNYFSLDESMYPQLMKMVIFDYIVNNADRKGGHCLVDGQGHLWGIDHGICFHSDHKLRTVIWDFAGQDIPAPLVDDLTALCEKMADPKNTLSETLCELLTPHEVNAFQTRLRRMATTRRFPRPGPGPNYPWPPV